MNRDTTSIVRAIVLIVGSAMALQSCREHSNVSDKQSLVNTSESDAAKPAPRSVQRETVWKAKWHTLTGDMKFGGEVGSESFPSTFSYDWGEGNVHEFYKDYIGFAARAVVFAPRSGLFRFTIGSDDGMQLAVDDRVILENQWQGGGSYATKTTQIQLSKGKHKLYLEYYDRSGGASASFDCDHELLTWVETVN